jgi:hypothetical protein
MGLILKKDITNPTIRESKRILMIQLIGSKNSVYFMFRRIACLVRHLPDAPLSDRGAEV